MPAFFLDYDGTLTPIVDNPFEAKLSEEARAAPDLPLSPPDLPLTSA